MSFEIVDCFSSYAFQRKTGYSKTGRPFTYTDYWDLRNLNGVEVFPNASDPLGSETGTPYESFRDWLVNDAVPSSLDFLLEGTVLEGKNSQMLVDCRDAWESRREELIKELSQIGGDYEDAYQEE